MFNASSRYAELPQYELETTDGRRVWYVGRRLVPRNRAPDPESVSVARNDRLDIIASRTLGDPQLFWQIGDANQELDPFALTHPFGKTISIPRT